MFEQVPVYEARKREREKERDDRMAVAVLATEDTQIDVRQLQDGTLPEPFHALLEHAVLASERAPHDPMERAFQRLAFGHDVETSVRGAKQYLTAAIRESYSPGKGHGPVRHLNSGAVSALGRATGPQPKPRVY